MNGTKNNRCQYNAHPGFRKRCYQFFLDNSPKQPFFAKGWNSGHDDNILNKLKKEYALCDLRFPEQQLVTILKSQLMKMKGAPYSTTLKEAETNKKNKNIHQKSKPIKAYLTESLFFKVTNSNLIGNLWFDVIITRHPNIQWSRRSGIRN